MLAPLADLDNISTRLRDQRATDLAARRAAWRDMTPQQRRRLTKAAIRHFENWLEERTGPHGRRKPA
jgi:hypothetical protein